MIAFTGYTLVNLLMVYVKSYWLFIICYGFLPGITIGLGYLPSMYIAWTYFPKQKSMITGVILFTAGISASILSPITTYVVNPNSLPDYDTNPAVYNNVPSMFRFLFFYFAALTLVACAFQPQPFVSRDYQEKKLIDKEIAMSRRMSKVGGAKSRVNSIRIPKTTSKANLARTPSKINVLNEDGSH